MHIKIGVEGLSHFSFRSWKQGDRGR